MRNILPSYRAYRCVYVILRTCPHAIAHVCVFLLLVSAAHRVKINVNAIVDSLKIMNGLCVERGRDIVEIAYSFPLNYGQNLTMCFNGNNKDGDGIQSNASNNRKFN